MGFLLRQGLTVALLHSLNQQLCWGFVREVAPFLPPHLKIQNSHRMIQRYNSQFQADDDISDALDGPSRKDVELWLDLRETALFPQEAIDYLKENIGADTPDHIDRVVLSKETMEKLILQTETTQFSFFYTHGDDLVLSCKDTQQSLPCGKVVRQQKGVLFNPIFALDIVLTNGGWVLMEQNTEMDESMWVEEVASLLTFLLSSTSATASLDLNGGLDLSGSAVEGSIYSTPAGNGVAISCPSGSLLMEVSKSIMTLTSLPTGSCTSPGGILLPSGGGPLVEDDLSSSSIILPNESGGGSEDRLPIAVVLPLDVALWEMAIDLVTDSAEDEDGSDFGSR